MTEDNSNVTIIVPPKPQPHAELIAEAESSIRYLNLFTQSAGLNTDLRLAMNEVQNTLKNLRQAVITLDEQAAQSHERQVELLKSSRLI